MSTISNVNCVDIEHAQQEREKQNLQAQQEQYRQLQRDLADAISRLAPLDDIRILLASGAKPNQPVTQGLHPIHYAVYQNFVAAARLLILRGCDINAMDDNGYTPVHLGAERGYYQLLEFLIQNGAKVCFTDKRKQNYSTTLADEPLSLALKKGHFDCAELLLKNGADPNARYFLGSEINRINILKVAAIKLLLKYGADPDSRDRSGLSPLMRAARNPLGYATVKVLIDYGADVNDIASEKHDYRTILHHSIFSGNVDLIRLLLTSGAKYPILNFDKPSPLDIAIISGSPEIVKLLIEFNADVNHGARSIGLPLSVALTQHIKNKYEIVKLLLDGGADPNSIVVTSTRTCGPPIHDYLNSIHQCSILTTRRSLLSSSSGGSLSSSMSAAATLERDEHLATMRMLLNYGARVLLVKSPNSSLLGCGRTLEKLHDELNFELLHLLIDAAEEIDWLSMSKVIYNCLRRLNESRTNELNDPSQCASITPQTIVQMIPTVIASIDCRNKTILEDILKQIKLAGTNVETETSAISPQQSTQEAHIIRGVLTLRQIARIQIRRHLSVQNGLKGRKLVRSISQIPVPTSLKNYLAYQNDSIPLSSFRYHLST